MKLFNSTENRVGNYKTIDTQDGTMYPNKLTEEQLNAYGYYRVKYESMPNRRYYNSTPSQSIVGTEYVIGYTVTDKPLNEVQEAMLRDLKEAFLVYAERPKVDTGLGYIVDGGRNDLVNFQIGKEFGFPAVKDAYGIMHPIDANGYDAIIHAIKAKGISLYQQKWAKEEEILNLPDVSSCVLYEHTPYDYTITQDDVDTDVEGTLTLGETVVRYKNNVKEW